MAGSHHGLGDGDVLLKNTVGTIDHDGGVTGAERLHGQLKAAAVVQMHHHRHGGLGGSSGHIGVEHRGGCVFQGAGGRLHDDGGAQLLRRGNDRLNHFHVLGVECADGVMVLLSVQHQFLRSNQSHNKNLPYGFAAHHSLKD